MKKNLRNIIIFLFYLISIPFWRSLFLTKPLLRVWCLHEIKDNQVEAFEKKLAYLKKHFNLITPEQFSGGEFIKDRVNFLVTFDDGYDSWLKNALPILDKHNVKAIFFLEKGFEDKAGVIRQAGHALGGHSVSHSRLTELNSEELKKEVNGSVKSPFFAYPFGDRQSFNEEVIKEVKEAGYSYAFTILPGFNYKKTNPRLMHRDSLDPDVSDLIFRLWLKGSYDLIKR